MEGHSEAPSTIKEVGIHVGYMRDDIRELKDIVKALPTAFVSIKEHQEVVDRVTVLETAIDKVKTRIVGAAITMLVVMVLAQYGLDTLFK